MNDAVATRELPRRRSVPHRSEPAALETIDLTRSFRVGKTLVPALRGVSLHVARGELVAIMGPSGCGKSTLLHALGGMLAPTSGRVVVDGQELSSLSDGARTDLRRRKIGFVFQKFNLFPTLSVEGNLRLAERLSLGRRSAREGGGRRRAILEMLGLGTKLHNRPMELSGGEQQRVALARAVIHQPAILLADEPTGNLDSASSENVLEMMRRIHRELSQTIVLITHDIDVAEAAERIVLMKDGVLVER
jgi:putative ABC transport system ATP-binding protein